MLEYSSECMKRLLEIQIWNLEEKSSLEKETSMEVRNEDKSSHEETVKYSFYLKISTSNYDARLWFGAGPWGRGWPDVAHHRLESIPEEVLESVGPRESLIQTLKRAMRKMDTISTDLPAI
ncbi:hypothetical protein E5288_WYG019641 [Bos mutus]|uniref:Uncharacterized protein n=1 Tax=Bos mutus TaxID=72004 RepID=A0A6B0RXE0_9CETA|nr:hypothetical protein [Bos mutus]